ncbi:MAG: FAD-dependent oxidoreductase [Candidatus Micrarchaeota archaeon]
MKGFVLVKKEEIGESILRLELAPKDGTPLSYKPGQFINLGLERGGTLVKRPYSIASSPGYKNLELCIKIVGGEFTSLLQYVEEGTEFTVDGPFGPAFYDEKKDFVLVAGGVGIVPMMSILRYRAKRKGGNAILFYSARSLPQMPYFEELQALSKTPGIKAFFALTREICEGWKYHCGRFGEEDFRKSIPYPQKFNYFVCGKNEMVEEVKKTLLLLGAKPENSHFEGWGV